MSPGGLDFSATSSPKRFGCVKMNLDTGAAVNNQKEQEMEYSVGLPVMNGFLMVELGNSKDTTKTGFSDP